MMPDNPDKEVGVWVMRLVTRKRNEPFYSSMLRTNSRISTYGFYVACRTFGINIKESYEPAGKDSETEKTIVFYETTISK
jgi:hypothetical protein